MECHLSRKECHFGDQWMGDNPQLSTSVVQAVPACFGGGPFFTKISLEPFRGRKLTNSCSVFTSTWSLVVWRFGCIRRENDGIFTIKSSGIVRSSSESLFEANLMTSVHDIYCIIKLDGWLVIDVSLNRRFLDNRKQWILFQASDMCTCLWRNTKEIDPRINADRNMFGELAHWHYLDQNLSLFFCSSHNN